MVPASCTSTDVFGGLEDWKLWPLEHHHVEGGLGLEETGSSLWLKNNGELRPVIQEFQGDRRGREKQRPMRARFTNCSEPKTYMTLKEQINSPTSYCKRIHVFVYYLL